MGQANVRDRCDMLEEIGWIAFVVMDGKSYGRGGTRPYRLEVEDDGAKRDKRN
jgi:hypothetical protein